MKQKNSLRAVVMRLGASNVMEIMRESYGDIYCRVSFILAYRFGIKAEPVHDEFLYWKDKGEKRLKEAMDDCKVTLTETDRQILDTLVKARQHYFMAKEYLIAAIAIHESAAQIEPRKKA